MNIFNEMNENKKRQQASEVMKTVFFSHKQNQSINQNGIFMPTLDLWLMKFNGLFVSYSTLCDPCENGKVLITAWY